MASSMLAFRGNQKANRVSGVLGLYWYARRTSPRAIETLSRIGLSVSPKSIHTGVLSLRRDALERAREVARDDNVPFMVVHDNLQFRLNVGQTTLTSHSTFLHTTTAYVTPMFEATHATMACDPTEMPEYGRHGTLTASDIQPDTVETQRMDTIMAYHVMSILVELSSIPHFSAMRCDLRNKLPSVHPIEIHKTEIFPLSAMPLNETSQRGNRKVLETLFEQQLKVPKDKVRQLNILQSAQY